LQFGDQLDMFARVHTITVHEIRFSRERFNPLSALRRGAKWAFSENFGP